MQTLLSLIILLSFCCCPSKGAEAPDPPAPAACRLIVEAISGKVILRQGPCEIRRSPNSTFKIPLAVMGFDSGILTDEHRPLWKYLPEYTSNREEERRDIDPTSWEKDSVVWYSQKLTGLMGRESFQKYISQFHYGNGDLSGNPGKNDGLTQAWLDSSLQISPDEQVEFLRKLLAGKLGVPEEVQRKTEAILPRFPAAEGWTVTGKTGTGFQKNTDQTPNRSRQQGWFVGWADKGGERVVFAEFVLDDKKEESYAGPRVRTAFIRDLPGIMKNKTSSPWRL